MTTRTRLIPCIAAAALLASVAPDAAPRQAGAGQPAAGAWTNEQDHQQMMEQLGITALRPGPSGNEQAPNHANVDEALANPFPDLPDALTLKNGAARDDARRSGGTRGGWRSSRTSSARSTDASRRTCPACAGPSRRRWTASSARCRSSAGSSSGTWTTPPRRRSRSTSTSSSSRRPDAKGPVPVMIMFRKGSLPQVPGGPPPPRDPWVPPPAPGRRSAGDRAAHRGWLGVRVPEPDERAGRQRRRADARDHRPGEPGAAAQARRLGRAARLGVGRRPRARLPRDRSGGGRDARRHRRRLALRQGRAGDDGVRAAIRGGAGRVVGQGRHDAAPAQLRRGRREPHGLGRVPLDGRQLPEVRGVGLEARRRHSRRPARGLARADRALRAAADVRQLRHPREGRREVARSAGELHGRRSPPRRCSACSAPRDCRRPKSYQTAKMPPPETDLLDGAARVAAARRRPHRCAELEALHPVGEPRSSPGRRRSTRSAPI